MVNKMVRQMTISTKFIYLHIRCGYILRQPGTVVLNRPNARQLENFTELSLKTSSKLLESIKCFFSHVKRHGFLVHEISERGHTMEWLYLATLRKIRLKPNSEIFTQRISTH